MAKPPKPADTRTINRLVLFLDGTWNDDSGSRPSTHIVALRNLVQPVVPRTKANGQEDTSAPPLINQRVYYDTGVGTGWSDRLIGGLTGEGLEANVRQAYKFISQFYRDASAEISHTEIAVFGFSRGAFTARSLVGYIAASGLLRREHCTVENEAKAWAYYRQKPKDRSPGERATFDPLVHADVRVSCLGVFDTVGALGIPSVFMHYINKAQHGFHDTEVSSIMDVGLHALAIDENRAPFVAALWQLPKHRNFKRVEQVWFPGAHADVGGSYEDNALSLNSLRWMLDRTTALEKVMWSPDADDIRAPADQPAQHDPRTWFYKLATPWPLLRVINQTIPDGAAEKYVINEFKPYESPIGEMIHWSALDRLGRDVAVNSGDSTRKMRYEPLNLVWMLPRIALTYNANASRKLETKALDAYKARLRTRPGDKANTMLVVRPMTIGGRSVEVELDPAKPAHCDMVLDLLAEIKARGVG
jgi:uncharacterized protein (DUF2235 family)